MCSLLFLIAILASLCLWLLNNFEMSIGWKDKIFSDIWEASKNTLLVYNWNAYKQMNPTLNSKFIDEIIVIFCSCELRFICELAE